MALAAPQGDGASLRTHLQRLARSTRRTDPRLTGRLPECVAPLWEVFCVVSGGDEPLRMSELDAWQRLHGAALTGWEIDTLIDMDRAARAEVAKQRPKPP